MPFIDVEKFVKKDDSPLIFISAGDPSGDVHAARLVQILSQKIPNAQIVGYAGGKTAATCCNVFFDLTQYAVMMLKKALLNLPNYIKLLKQTDDFFRKFRPDIVILVDFPSFNWKIAQKAKKIGASTVYFMPPQIWGWGQWRVKKMRKYVDLVLSCFSFENDWFKARDCRSTLVGHPFFEEARSRKIDENFLESLQQDRRPYLTLLPGSRNQEVTNNLPLLLTIVDKVLKAVPDVQPVFAAFNESQANYIDEKVKEKGLNFPVYAKKTPELLRGATCCLGVSGSVSIELLSLLKPTVIVYKISKIEHFALRFLKKVKYITLTNLLYVDSLEGETPFYPARFLPKTTEHTPRERELMLFPEFITYEDCSDEAAKPLIDWFQNDARRSEVVNKMKNLKELTDFVENPIDLASDRIIDVLRSKERERKE